MTSTLAKKIEYKHEGKWIASIAAQFKKAKKEPNRYIDYALDIKTMEVYIKYKNLEEIASEFKDGEFLAKMRFPIGSDPNKTYPFVPPMFMFLTPNGLYTIKTESLCVDQGSYHSKDYKYGGIKGFAEYLMSGLVTWEMVGSGIRLLSTTKDDKIILSKKSKAYNLKKNQEILKLFTEITSEKKETELSSEKKETELSSEKQELPTEKKL